MPIYEYGCKDCRRKTTVFLRSFSVEPKALVCDSCGGSNLVRLISRVAVVKSEAARMEAMADPSSWGGVDENDPKSIAKMMRSMQNQMGEAVDPQMEEAIEKMEQGEIPDEPSYGGGMEDF
ncbi:MAG: zinc ribbon domain-containing protein [Chloroflexi bacterium]|jgi:putative FmdB family regulatory protein|nr:zinc ribbon domain-containing protein [Chloroflexota bacterium]MBT7081466.1 zinc ribbon domain-containing protein [Chloroflexota bacterium]MBT7289747.1 zinc ribbon domain-containing protein [Chloroflexota bacterium]